MDANAHITMLVKDRSSELRCVSRKELTCYNSPNVIFFLIFLKTKKPTAARMIMASTVRNAAAMPATRHTLLSLFKHCLKDDKLQHIHKGQVN